MPQPTSEVPPSEFTYWIAQRGEGGAIVRAHSRGKQGKCDACRQPWPCGHRKRAQESFKIGTDQAPDLKPLGQAWRGAVTVWRAEMFWDDEIRTRAEWLGRADYPDPDVACWWLAITLETSRHRRKPGGIGWFWGEVTAGQVCADDADSKSGQIVLLSSWRPIEERGATATAYLRAPNEDIEWDERPERSAPIDKDGALPSIASRRRWSSFEPPKREWTS